MLTKPKMIQYIYKVLLLFEDVQDVNSEQKVITAVT